ncbi:MAG: glycosyltransferase family 39 protein, partial [Sulfurimonas sp.]|nr:glycosyltransferase family 39 protein [Sulfurimonas sp.]
MTKTYEKEIKIVGLILFCKLIILALIPLTGDEAYFIKWASHLSSGYYDHPPMVGWLIYLMSFISEDIIFFRLFSFMAAITVAFSIYKIALLYIDENKAYLLFLLFLASPVDILMSLFTNDIPLVLFGTLGTQFFLYSLKKEQTIKYAILSGLFLGAAFLSKYFSVFLFFSLFVFAISVYKTRAIKTLLIAIPIVLLAIAQNMYFNYNCCWNNIMFNFFARTESHYNFETFSNFILNQIGRA